MILIITFFTSGLCLAALIAFKQWENRHGIKSFAAARHELDHMALEKLHALRKKLRYVNWTTARLLFVFGVRETFIFTRESVRRVEDFLSKTKFVKYVRGFRLDEGRQTRSEFLAQIKHAKNKGSELQSEVKVSEKVEETASEKVEF